MAYRICLIVILLGLTLAACGKSGGGGGGGEAPTEGVVIGSGGGTAESKDGLVSVTVPPGALDSDQLITVEPISEPPEGAIAAYDFGPDGLQFNQPVTLTMTYNESDLPEGVSEDGLLLRTFQNGQWMATETPENSSVDTGQNTVTALTTHFTTFGVVPLSFLPAPTVSLSPSPSSGPAPLTITFTATALDPDGGPIVSYEWDFENDGTFDQTTTVDTTSNTYNSAGSFEAKVKVTDNDGQTAEATASVSVGTTNPIVSVSALPTSGSTPLLVIFTATASDPDGGSLASYEWDFTNDGTFDRTTTSGATSEIYIIASPTLAASFTARVRVTDDEGETAEATVTVTVTLPPPQTPTLSVGTRHACTSNGTVECWGENFSGQLGNGTITDSNIPVPVSGITTATAVSAGGYHTCAVLSGGTVSCWGDNSSGQLGNGTNTGPDCGGSCSPTPVSVTGIFTATAVSAGFYHTCAVLSGGTVSCWGDNSSGQLGNGTITDSSIPVQVNGIFTAVAVSHSEGDYTCAVLSDGTVKCWGSNSNGQLGNGTNTGPDCGGSCSPTPVSVTGIFTAVAVSGGFKHSCAVLSGGTVSCWGENSDGRLGNGTNTASNMPVTVSGISMAVAVSAGLSHTCALLAPGTVKCWGDNDSGQLGDGTNTASNLPVTVSGISSATAVSSGFEYSCALLLNGTVDCWGIPILLLLAIPSSGAVPLTVDFTAVDVTVLGPDGGSIVKYEWDFDGDGTFEQNTGTTNTASHTYNTGGSFTAKVRVTDDKGQKAEDTTTVEAGVLKGMLTLSANDMFTDGTSDVYTLSADVTLSLDQEGFHPDLSSATGTYSEVLTSVMPIVPCSFTVTTIGDLNSGISFDPACDSGCFFTLSGDGTETTTDAGCGIGTGVRDVGTSSSNTSVLSGLFFGWSYTAIRSPDGTLIGMDFNRTDSFVDPLGNTSQVNTTGRLE